MKTELAFKINEQGKIPKDAIGVMQDFFTKRAKRYIKITLEDKKKLKSHEQLGYWFAVVVTIFSNHTGYTQEEIHEILKVRAGYIEEKEIEGKKITVIKSFANASVMDIMAIMGKTFEWAEYLGINLPLPDPNWRDNLERERNN